jgi:ribosome-associated protein
MKIMEFQLREGEEFIQLTQLLKAVGIAENGAMAGQMVIDGLVKLNGERESRKRAKLRRGDVISIFEEEIKIK